MQSQPGGPLRPTSSFGSRRSSAAGPLENLLDELSAEPEPITQLQPQERLNKPSDGLLHSSGAQTARHGRRSAPATGVGPGTAKDAPVLLPDHAMSQSSPFNAGQSALQALAGSHASSQGASGQQPSTSLASALPSETLLNTFESLAESQSSYHTALGSRASPALSLALPNLSGTWSRPLSINLPSNAGTAPEVSHRGGMDAATWQSPRTTFSSASTAGGAPLLQGTSSGVHLPAADPEHLPAPAMQQQEQEAERVHSETGSMSTSSNGAGLPGSTADSQRRSSGSLTAAATAAVGSRRSSSSSTQSAKRSVSQQMAYQHALPPRPGRRSSSSASQPQSEDPPFSSELSGAGIQLPEMPADTTAQAASLQAHGSLQPPLVAFSSGPTSNSGLSHTSSHRRSHVSTQSGHSRHSGSSRSSDRGSVGGLGEEQSAIRVTQSSSDDYSADPAHESSDWEAPSDGMLTHGTVSQRHTEDDPIMYSNPRYDAESASAWSPRETTDSQDPHPAVQSHPITHLRVMHPDRSAPTADAPIHAAPRAPLSAPHPVGDRHTRSSSSSRTFSSSSSSTSSSGGGSGGGSSTTSGSSADKSHSSYGHAPARSLSSAASSGGTVSQVQLPLSQTGVAHASARVSGVATDRSMKESSAGGSSGLSIGGAASPGKLQPVLSWTSGSSLVSDNWSRPSVSTDAGRAAGVRPAASALNNLSNPRLLSSQSAGGGLRQPAANTHHGSGVHSAGGMPWSAAAGSQQASMGGWSASSAPTEETNQVAAAAAQFAARRQQSSGQASTDSLGTGTVSRYEVASSDSARVEGASGTWGWQPQATLDSVPSGWTATARTATLDSAITDTHHTQGGPAGTVVQGSTAHSSQGGSQMREEAMRSAAAATLTTSSPQAQSPAPVDMLEGHTQGWQVGNETLTVATGYPSPPRAASHDPYGDEHDMGHDLYLSVHESSPPPRKPVNGDAAVHVQTRSSTRTASVTPSSVSHGSPDSATADRTGDRTPREQPVGGSFAEYLLGLLHSLSPAGSRGALPSGSPGSLVGSPGPRGRQDARGDDQEATSSLQFKALAYLMQHEIAATTMAHQVANAGQPLVDAAEGMRTAGTEEGVVRALHGDSAEHPIQTAQQGRGYGGLDGQLMPQYTVPPAAVVCQWQEQGGARLSEVSGGYGGQPAAADRSAGGATEEVGSSWASSREASSGGPQSASRMHALSGPAAVADSTVRSISQVHLQSPASSTRSLAEEAAALLSPSTTGTLDLRLQRGQTAGSTGTTQAAMQQLLHGANGATTLALLQALRSLDSSLAGAAPAVEAAAAAAAASRRSTQSMPGGTNPPPSDPPTAPAPASHNTLGGTLSQTLGTASVPSLTAVTDGSDGHVTGSLLSQLVTNMLQQRQAVPGPGAGHDTVEPARLPSVAHSMPDLPSRTTASNTVSSTGTTRSAPAVVTHGAVTVPTQLSRLSQATTGSEPLPEPPQPPQLPGIVRAAVRLPSSAAEMTRQGYTSSGGGATADARRTGSSAGGAVSPSRSLSTDPTKPSTHSTESQRADAQLPVDGDAQATDQQQGSGPQSTEQLKDEIESLLKRLRDAGHHVPPHAAMVLSLLIQSEDSGAGARSPQSVAAELRAVGPPPREAGWVPQVKPTAMVATTQVLVSHAIAGPTPRGSDHSSVTAHSTDPQQGSLPSNTSQANAPVSDPTLARPTFTSVVQTLSGIPTVSTTVSTDAQRHTVASLSQPTEQLLVQQSGILPLSVLPGAFRPLDPVPEKIAVRLAHPCDLGQAPTLDTSCTFQAVAEQVAGGAGGGCKSGKAGKRRGSRKGSEGGASALDDGAGAVVDMDLGILQEPDVFLAPEARPKQEKKSPRSAVSHLQAFRAAKRKAAAAATAATQMVQPGPSSPRKAAAVRKAALDSASPLLSGHHRTNSATETTHTSAATLRPPSPCQRRGVSASGAAPTSATTASVSTKPLRSQSAERVRTATTTPRTAVTPRTASTAAAPSPRTRTPGGAALTPKGGSILDSSRRLSPLPAGAPTAAATAAGSSLHADAIARPFAWQERETRSWLRSLGLDVVPEEEQAALLDNPYRNGVALCDIASAITGVPVAQAVVPPTTAHEAKSNLLLALDHLGLLGPGDLGLAAKSARGISPSRDAPRQSGTYSGRLKERQATTAYHLLSEVDKVVQHGRRETVWGLLHHIRQATSSQQPYLGPSTHVESAQHAAARAAAAMRDRMAAMDEQPAGSTHRTRRAPGDASVGQSIGSTMAAAKEAAQRPVPPMTLAQQPPWRRVREVNAVMPWGDALDAPFVLLGPAEDYGPTWTMSSGVGPLRYTVGPRALSPGRRALLERALQQEDEELLALQQAQEEEDAAAQTALGRAGRTEVNWCMSQGGSVSARDTASATGARPLWSSPRLPYTPEQVSALEKSLLRWLTEFGAIDDALASQGFGALAREMADGVFLCWLVQRITGEVIKGVNKRPMVPAHRRSNILRAIAVLRHAPNMSRRCLNYEEALLSADRAALTGLLEDLHRLATGQPSAGTVWQPDAQPYLPYDTPAKGPHSPPPDHQTLVVRPNTAQPSISGSRSSRRPASAPRPQRPAASDSTLLSARSTSPVPARPHPLGIASLFVTPEKAHLAQRAHRHPSQAPGDDTLDPDAGWRRERRAAAAVAGAPRVMPWKPPTSATSPRHQQEQLIPAMPAAGDTTPTSIFTAELDEYLYEQYSPRSATSYGAGDTVQGAAVGILPEDWQGLTDTQGPTGRKQHMYPGRPHTLNLHRS